MSNENKRALAGIISANALLLLLFVFLFIRYIFCEIGCKYQTNKSQSPGNNSVPIEVEL